VLEQGAEGVRLMTVHAAKGLEFPIVILADMTAHIAAGDPDRFVDARQALCATRLLRCAPWELRDNDAQERLRERAEGIRVAYVAATRARDLLVVPALGDEELDGWLSPLNKAIYPARDRYRNGVHATGCPQFGEASVVERPYFTRDEPSVKPGLHTPCEGQHEVVWWDPRALKLAPPANLGLRQQEILMADSTETESPSLVAYRNWRDKRNKATLSAQAKQFDVFTASEAIESPADFAVEITIEFTEKTASRPTGPRFGTLVHTILRDATLDADYPALTALATVHGRLLGATPEESEHAIIAVSSALQHPLLTSARNAERLHRELPVLLPLDQNKVLEGVIDLAFSSEGRWHIVDFKTDADIAPNRVRYERQLQWYGLALSRLNKAPVEAHLLCI
jgi:ATP-dependent helicase/nuclease subunit A